MSPYTTATFSNITFIGPKCYDGFQNTTDYINGGDFFPNNGSSLGKFQSAMQIRRSSHLACFNSVAVGYPIGLIIDGEKGNTAQTARDGQLYLQNIVFAGMDVTGSDANKKYEDQLLTDYDENKKGIFDASQPSFSTTFFLGQLAGRMDQLRPEQHRVLIADTADSSQHAFQSGSKYLWAGEERRAFSPALAV